MEEFAESERRLCMAKCGIRYNPQLEWEKIKNDVNLLNWAISYGDDGKQNTTNWVNEDKRHHILNGVSICESMLLHPEDFQEKNSDIYQKLIDLIFKYKSIASTREYIGLDYYDVYSFLVLALKNPNLKLTRSQKELAICEAYYQVKYKGVVHGIEPYGAGYLILNNPNWDYNEKIAAIKCIWSEKVDFDRTYAQWECDGYVDLCKMMQEAKEEEEKRIKKSIGTFEGRRYRYV